MTAPKTASYTLSDTLAVAMAALKGIASAKTARDNGRDKVSSFNRDMAVSTARAVDGGFFEAFSEKVSAHANYKAFKATVSASRAVFVQTGFSGAALVVPKGQGWTLGGTVYEAGATVSGAAILASILAGDIEDTSPLVLTKAASKIRNAEKAERSAQMQERLNAIAAYLMTPPGRKMVKDGLDAETILANGLDENGTVSAELNAILAKGHDAIREADMAYERNEAAMASQENKDKALAFIRANISAELVDELSAIISAYRVASAKVEPTTNLQAVSSAAA